MKLRKLKMLGKNESSAYYPNFAAWTRFYSEPICNSLHWKLFRYEGDWDVCHARWHLERRIC